MAKPTKAPAPSAKLLARLRAIAEMTDASANDAQLHAFDAMEATTTAAALKHVALAFDVGPLSADAWTVLADAAPAGSPLALELRRQAVAAGRLAIGPLGFVHGAGAFWGHIETRPYMRALAALAEALWAIGEHDAAITEAREQLRLNPNDNQGARHILMGWLLARGRDAEALGLHAAYPEDGFAAWPWALVLLRFRANPEAADTAEALRDALDVNPHVGAVLAGHVQPPTGTLSAYTLGSLDEAKVVLHEIGEAWAATPGAREWLAGMVPKRRRRATKTG